MENKQDLKGGEIEKEDLNNCNSVEDNEKEGDMVKGSKKKSAKSRVPARRTIRKKIVRGRNTASIIRRKRRS